MKFDSCANGPIKPFQAKARPAGLCQAWRGLTVLLLVLGLALASLSPAVAGDGALDPTFNIGTGQFSGVQIIPEIRGHSFYPYLAGPPPSPYNNFSLLFGNFYGMTVAPDPMVQHNSICRLTNTGALDPNFVSANIHGEVRGAYIYPHNDLYFPDKILIWGNFNASSGSQYFNGFARLNADGQIDPSFTPVFFGGAVNTVMVQGSGLTAKILVGGYDLRVADMDGPSYQLVRLNYDCTPDPDFTKWGAPGGYVSNIRSDAYFPGYVRIFLTYPKNDGSGGTYYTLVVDASVPIPSPSNPPYASLGDETVDGPIYNISRQSDNKWMICGQFKNVYNTATAQWVPKNRVARLLSDGTTLDTTYDVGVGPLGSVTQVMPMNSAGPTYDDRMVVTGGFITWNGAASGHLVRLNTDGTLDDTFAGGTRADDRIRSLLWSNNGTGGRIAGYFRNYNGSPRGGIAALDGNGNLITTSYANITAVAGYAGSVHSLATQSDGKIIIGGDFNGVGGKYRDGLARINPDGSLDTSFTGGVDGIVRSVAVQADGKILVGGTFGQCQGFACTSLARVNPTGYLDTTFKPLLAGVGMGNNLNRVYQVVPQADGKVMIAGELWGTVNGPAARLNSNGTPDPSFDASGFSIPGAEWFWGSRLAAAGNKWVITGGYDTDMGSSGGFLARLNSDGSVDPDFGPPALPNHIQTTDGQIADLLLQPDGKIVVSGMFSHIIDGSGNPARSAIARFSANGVLDSIFTPSLTPPINANTIMLPAMALQPNGKILIEANFLYYSGGYNYNYISTQVARLNPNGSLDPYFSLGTPANGWFGVYNSGNSILRLPNGKALIGGNFTSYSGTPAFSLVRIFAGPAGFNPAALFLLLLN